MREWLNAQAAGGYVDLRRRPLHAAARARRRAGRRGQPGVPARRLPADRPRRCATSRRSPRRSAAARASAGTSTPRPLRGLRALLPPRLPPTSSQSWLPALDGVEEKLERRRARRRRRLRPRRLDDAHGGGVPAVRLPRLRLPRRLDRAAARAHGRLPRAAFEVASAQDFPGTRLRPGDDVRLPARHGRPGRRRAPHPRGARAGRHVADRRAVRRRPRRGQPQPGRPRLLRASRRCVCTPASLSQDVGLALGAQAGEARLRDVVTAAGFTRFRRVAETPFNLVLEARP